MRAPLLKPLATVLAVLPLYGPISVMFEKIAEVNGVAVVPEASLSDSNPSEVETVGLSAI